MQPWHFLFALAFGIWTLSSMWSNVELRHVFDYDEPIYRRKNKLMDPEAFDELAGYVLQHPFVGNWTAPQREAGLVSRLHPWAHCNDKGFYKLCSSSDIRFLCEPFLKKVRQKGTNAFVLKLFAGYASDYDSKPSYFYSSLGLQGSDGPEIEDGNNHWMPKVVSILDIQVPDSMRGGQLQVFEDTNLQERERGNINPAGAARVEEPAANTLHTLRGDMWYTFSDYTVDGLVADAWMDMPADFRRLSLVFEQYQIDNSSYHGTLEYKVWKLHVDQETPVYAFGTMLWTVMGAFVGVSVNSGALQSGRLMPVVLGLLAGTGIGAAVGFAISFATINGYKLGWDLLIKVGDFIYDGHYIHSPEFTIWHTSAAVQKIKQSATEIAFGEQLTGSSADPAAGLRGRGGRSGGSGGASESNSKSGKSE